MAKKAASVEPVSEVIDLSRRQPQHARYGNGPGELAEQLRAKLTAKDEALADRYWARHNIDDLIQERTAFFDDLMREAWDACIPEKAASDSGPVTRSAATGAASSFPSPTSIC